MTVTLPDALICNHPTPLAWRKLTRTHTACLCPELAGHTGPHVCGHGCQWATPRTTR